MRGGEANAAPPIGPAFFGTGWSKHMTLSANQQGYERQNGRSLVPVFITVYEDRTFALALKRPPATNLILKSIGIEKGSGKNAVKKSRHYLKSAAERNCREEDVGSKMPMMWTRQ